jgi:hypothetical protein
LTAARMTSLSFLSSVDAYYKDIYKESKTPLFFTASRTTSLSF